jgi:type I restriction enzyme S subunit
MGRYQAYPEYKDSGVEWLGEVPKHWDSKQLKFLCSYNDEVISENLDPDFEIEYVDIGSVSAADGIQKTEVLRFDAAPSRARRIVRDGDVIVSTVRTYLEAIASIDNPPESLVVSTGFAVIRPSSQLQKRFAAYCMRAQGFIREVIARSVGVSYPAINASDLVNIKSPKPPLAEQEIIANFLDQETAKIDTLIEKQQQLIQLLKEKRQAVISHAVTKGLNPDVPMKDSGVEWLGEVPEDWATPSLNQVTCKIGDGLHSTPNYEDGTGYYFINGNNLIDGNIVIGASAKEVPEDDYKKHYVNLTSDSVLLSINGTVGNVAVYAGERVILGKSAAFINCAEKLYCRYLMFYLQSSNLKNFFELEVTGTTIFNLSLNSIRKMKVCIPPLEEQKEIEKSCVIQKEKYDRLISNALAAITLMQERRTALISAAVTGKIDVRLHASRPTGSA